jgi:hypothetical protein
VLFACVPVLEWDTIPVASKNNGGVPPSRRRKPNGNGQDPASRRRQDPTARRRRSPDQALKDAQQTIKRHRRGESMRDIAAALGLSKTTIERTIKDWRRALAEAGKDAEQAALLAKLGGGSRVVGSRSAQSNGSQDVEDEFDDEWGDVVIDRLSPWERLRWEWDHNQALLRADPENALALYRQGHLPATRPEAPEDYERHIARFRIPAPVGAAGEHDWAGRDADW